MFPFRELWCVDFEFRSDPGERPFVVCMVAREFKSGRLIRMWRDELLKLRKAPFDTGRDCAFVCYFAPAELGCFLELGWPMPANIIDLFTQHRVETNGRELLGKKIHKGPQSKRNSLLTALAIRGLAHIDAGEKDAMRALIMGPWSEAQKHVSEILDYCQTDVDPLLKLLSVMGPNIDWRRALFRGRYMIAVARMERTGIPVDAELYQRLATNWDALRLPLIEDVDKDFGAYENGSFREALFEQYLQAEKIPWERYPGGRLILDKQTFKEQAAAYPQLIPLYELRQTVSKLRLTDIPVGSSDHRARCMLSPFQTETGRNGPTKFIFGTARWLRGLIRPPEGMALAYCDWSSQEYAIAGALSGDERMMEDYKSDPYLAMAKAVGLAPPEANKKSHETIREVFKQVVLGISYGMGPKTMAMRTGLMEAEAREIIRWHRNTYKTLWCFIDSTIATASFTGKLSTIYGWPLHVGREIKPRSLMNFPMQAHGAEMMRIAAIAATEAGIEVCCPIHDAFLIAAPLELIDEHTAAMRDIMEKASRAITGGLTVRTDHKIIRSPDRYMDGRGKAMWDRVMTLLERLGTPGPGSHKREPNLLTSDTVDHDLLKNENVLQPFGVNLLTSENPVLFSSYNIDR
jgi:DNA polymerase I